LGEGWRIPTDDDFRILSLNKEKIPLLKLESYYIGSEQIQHSDDNQRIYYFMSDYIGSMHKSYVQYLRPVRDFNGDIALELLLKEF
jgi:hypothetical protein